MVRQKIKPALILDDDPNWATNIGRSVRRFGGLPVKHFFSIEAFGRSHKINYKDTNALADALRQYSAVISDNNFEGAKEETGDGYAGGLEFLMKYAGPALKTIPKSDRPILMSFAPSSESVIALNEETMWKQYGISSFHKMWETPAIGLAIRIAREYGVSLNRESIVTKICGQEAGDSGFGLPKAEFFMDLMFKHTDDGSFRGESLRQVEGDAVPMAWEEITGSLAEKMGIPESKLIKNVENEVAQRRAEIEGGHAPRKK